MGVSWACPKFLSTHYSNDSGVVAERNFQRFFTGYIFVNFTKDNLHVVGLYSIYSPLTAFR